MESSLIQMLEKLPDRKVITFGGAINEAGAVKSNKIKKTATSDFMEIERQRGISVSTSVLAFNFNDKKINILTHQDIKILLKTPIELFSS